MVTGTTVTDPELLKGMPEHESRVLVPSTMMAEIPQPIEDLAGYLYPRRHSELLRVEMLQNYNVDSDDDDFRRFLAGESAPNAEAKEPWLERIAADTAAGLRWRRLRLVTLPLTDYTRYECEWCYVYNADAGEDIRVLEVDPSYTDWFGVGDFFVIDGAEVVRMNYDRDDHWVGAATTPEAGTAAAYRTIAELGWDRATPFAQWWASHPEVHRAQAA